MKDNSKKIILDLCGGTGSWSRPYKEAGYDVRVITLPEYDVATYNPPPNVYGVIAAPPCTMFSLARTTAKTPRDLDAGMVTVKDCMRIIWQAKPKFWVMENPKGLLRHFMGRPFFMFCPSEFGADYNKPTDLWGYFYPPKKTHEYIRFAWSDGNNRKLPIIPVDYIKDKNMSNRAIARSITPKGFAEAFYRSNK